MNRRFIFWCSLILLFSCKPQNNSSKNHNNSDGPGKISAEEEERREDLDGLSTYLFEYPDSVERKNLELFASFDLGSEASIAALVARKTGSDKESLRYYFAGVEREKENGKIYAFIAIFQNGQRTDLSKVAVSEKSGKLKFSLTNNELILSLNSKPILSTKSDLITVAGISGSIMTRSASSVEISNIVTIDSNTETNRLLVVVNSDEKVKIIELSELNEKVTYSLTKKVDFSAAVIEKEKDLELNGGSDSFDSYGLKEKWVRASTAKDPNRTWYYLTPDGYLTKWLGIKGNPAGERVGYVGSLAYGNLTYLTDAKPEYENLDVKLNGKELSISRAEEVSGQFSLTIQSGDKYLYRIQILVKN